MSDSIIVNVNPSSTDLVVINANPNTTNQSVNVNDGIDTSIINVSSISSPNVSINPTDLNINETININQGGFVFSVNGKIGHVIITKDEIGLDQVDNTSDLNKPLSLAQITALALKANQSDLSLVSAAQDAFYVDTANKILKFGPVGNLVITNSANWIFTSQQVLSNYENWNQSFTNISKSSSFYVNLSTVSAAIWNSVYSTTRSNSSFWQQAYTNLLANSASYAAGGNLVNIVTGYLPLSGGYLIGNLSTSAILSSTNVIYALGGNSNLWNSVYSYINQTSANEEDQNEIVSFVLSNSSNILQVNSLTNNTSANWNSVYSSWNSNSAFDLAARTFVNNNSANSLQVNSKVNQTSANWDSVYTTWNQNSGLNLAARSFVNNNSSNSLQVNSKVIQTSGNWDSVYSSWNSNSAFDLAARSFVNSNSSNIINVNTKVNSTSANWDSAYTTWNQNSGLDLAARTFVNTNSSNILQVNSVTNNTSANWNSSFTTWNQNSGLDLAARTFVNTNSSNIINVNTKVNTTSGNWDSVYSSWNNLSSNLKAVENFVQTTSANNSVYNTVCSLSTNWNSVYTTWNQNSSLDLAARTFVNSNSSNILAVNSVTNNTSANWDSAYTTWNQNSGNLLEVQNFVQTTSADNSVYNTVFSLSANWNSSYTTLNQNSGLDLAARTFVNNNSSNIISLNTTVNTNSASWSSIYSLATGLSSDWSNLGKLTSTVTSDLSVGAITAAQVFNAGTTFQQFVQALLTKIYYPTFTNRTLTVTSNHGGNGTNVEIGTTSVQLTLNYTRGQIVGKTVNSIWEPNTFQNFRTGPATSYVAFSSATNTTNSTFTTTSAQAIILDGSNVYNVTCNYGQGDQPYDSRNNIYLTPDPENSVSTSMTLNGRRRAFFGADVQNFVPTTSPQVRALTQNLLNPQNGSQFTINVPAGANRVILAYPASLQAVTTIFYPPLQSDVKTTFTQTTVSVSAANNLFPTNYRVYYFTPLIPFGSATSYIITI